MSDAEDRPATVRAWKKYAIHPAEKTTWHQANSQEVNPALAVNPYADMQRIEVKQNAGRSGI